jgi:hypothetical protein
MEYKYFSYRTDPHLFICNETGEEGIDESFVLALDLLREDCGFPFVIPPGGGFRSKLHSREKKKEKAGEHNRGAADVGCRYPAHRMILVAKAISHGFTGIGVAKTFIHLDKRTTTPVIWTY